MSAEIKTLHVPFRDWLDNTQAGRIAYTYHRPDKPTGGTKGDADFILYAANRCLHIEFKDKDTAISANQRQRHNELAEVGITVHVVRDLAVAEELATAWRSTIDIIPVSHPAHKPTVLWKGASLRERPDGSFDRV